MLDRTTTLAATTNMANAIRALSMDTVQRANSGHPGMPMGMAEVAVALWAGHLRHNPKNPDWFDRDRFVLSNGHGSMLIYSLLHLTGYDVSIDDLKAFRTLHSKTPGHPERGYTPGVETTTGPLGQGIANAVGMALSEKILGSEFNRPGHAVVDHFTYVFLGDGCLMEGISHEACSLAGTLGLSKLIALYDDNGISIDGHIEGWFTDDTPKRFEAYGWQVLADVDGHDAAAVSAAIEQAKINMTQPTLICCKTTIGKGAPTKAGSHDSHGTPLGMDEIALTREAIGWPHAPFEIPTDVHDAWNATGKGATLEREWLARFDAYANAFPDLAAEFTRRMRGELPADFADLTKAFVDKTAVQTDAIATRKASLNTIEALVPSLPEIIGGSADLASSNLTMWKAAKPVTKGDGGNYVYYGVREFGMAAIMNGMLAHGGVRPFGGTYVMFSEYARNAIRMAALMKLGAVHILTHDSIALGQDGPTHQPVEQIATLRLMPNLDVWRPCDATETAVAWTQALAHGQTPTVLALSRQNLTPQKRNAEQIAQIARGGYVLSPETAVLDAVIIATGSEIELAIVAQKRLVAEGVHARVVSLPSTYAFDRQDRAYRDSVLVPGVPRVSVEAGVTDYWRKYVGLDGACFGIDTFGESAAPDVLFEHFKINAESVVNAVRSILAATDTKAL
jgi:transketolase